MAGKLAGRRLPNKQVEVRSQPLSEAELEKVWGGAKNPNWKPGAGNNALKFNPKALSFKDVPNKGFKSFEELKKFLKKKKKGYAWHHIVEQCESNANRSGFAAEQVNNVNNIVLIPHGKGSIHSAISRYYSARNDQLDNVVTRNFLNNKSFEEQWEFGIKQLKKFGDLIPTDKGWLFLPF